MSGTAPTRVATIGSPFCPEANPDDYGIATYTLANGATVTLESTRQSDTRDSFAPLSNPDRATVAGTKGEMEFHYQRSPQIEVNGTEEPWRRRRYADHAMAMTHQAFGPRVGVPRILALLAEYGLPATFFISSTVKSL